MKPGIKKTVTLLVSLNVIMFLFGLVVLPPLYDVFCDITGLNGKTGVIGNSEASVLRTDNNKNVTVEFDTNINNKLPWKFWTKTRKLDVTPGEIYEVNFEVENLATTQTYGQAVPSVTPASGSLYFKKTECFCFTRQELSPGEHKTMTVRFVVDPRLSENVKSMVLSYTFFSVVENISGQTENNIAKAQTNRTAL